MKHDIIRGRNLIEMQLKKIDSLEEMIKHAGGGKNVGTRRR